jgi:hypothetical protein
VLAQALEQFGDGALVRPSAAVFHSAPSGSSMDTKVGSPPMVRRTSSFQQVGVDLPAQGLIASHCSSV